jgi:hypothetical protein
VEREPHRDPAEQRFEQLEACGDPTADRLIVALSGKLGAARDSCLAMPQDVFYPHYSYLRK